jgi:D-alanine-D-alanine ligase
MNRPLHITVMLGGPSAEREVSLRSGAAVAAALGSLGHQVSELDPRTPDWQLADGTDVVFLALHGTYGEDGTVQTRLDALGVPYTGCDAESSQIAFDKVLTKKKLVAAGVPTPRFVVVDSPAARWPRGWNPPVVLKPSRQGSSVGLQFVERVADWSQSLAEAFRHDTTVLVEERVAGRETTVGILGGQVLPVVEVRPRTGVYDYHNKYTAGATEYLCPAPFDAELTAKIQAVGRDAFAAVGARDYARVDVMVSAAGEPFVLEINTLPGMTETSLLPKAAAAAGIGYPQLCQQMVDLALKRKP